MKTIPAVFPPRYASLLRLTVSAALPRLLAFVPFAVAYVLPVGSPFRLILLLCPVLWVLLVFPARVRYGEALAALAADPRAPIRKLGLLPRGSAWRAACRGRWKLMRARALPLCILLALLLVLFVFFDAFSAVRVLLNVFGAVATAFGVMAAFIPRLLMGENPLQPAGAIGGVAVLFAVLVLCLALFGVGAFRTSAYRFGVTAGMPKNSELRALRKENLRLWLPTLLLFGVTLLFSFRELGLLLANVLGAASVFSVGLRLHQSILLALTALSYCILLPVRKYNAAVWARERLRKAK